MHLTFDSFIILAIDIYKSKLILKHILKNIYHARNVKHIKFILFVKDHIHFHHIHFIVNKFNYSERKKNLYIAN